jgi:hypothetical protein
MPIRSLPRLKNDDPHGATLGATANHLLGQQLLCWIPNQRLDLAGLRLDLYEVPAIPPEVLSHLPRQIAQGI